MALRARRCAVASSISPQRGRVRRLARKAALPRPAAQHEACRESAKSPAACAPPSPSRPRRPRRPRPAPRRRTARPRRRARRPRPGPAPPRPTRRPPAPPRPAPHPRRPALPAGARVNDVHWHMPASPARRACCSGRYYRQRLLAAQAAIHPTDALCHAGATPDASPDTCTEAHQLHYVSGSWPHSHAFQASRLPRMASRPPALREAGAHRRRPGSRRSPC